MKKYTKHNAYGALFDDSRVAVVAGYFDEVAELEEA